MSEEAVLRAEEAADRREAAGVHRSVAHQSDGLAAAEEEVDSHREVIPVELGTHGESDPPGGSARHLTPRRRAEARQGRGGEAHVQGDDVAADVHLGGAGERPERAGPRDERLEAEPEVDPPEEAHRPVGGVLEHRHREAEATRVRSARHVEVEASEAEADARGGGGRGGSRSRGGGGGRALPDDPLDHAETAVDAVHAPAECLGGLDHRAQDPQHELLAGARRPVRHVDAAEADLAGVGGDPVRRDQVAADDVVGRHDRPAGVVPRDLLAGARAGALIREDGADTLIAVHEELIVDARPVGAARRGAAGDRHRLAGGEGDVAVAADDRRGAHLGALVGRIAAVLADRGAEGAERQVRGGGGPLVAVPPRELRAAAVVGIGALGRRLREGQGRREHEGETEGNIADHRELHGVEPLSGGVMELDDPRCALRFRGRVLCRGRDTSETELYPTLLFFKTQLGSFVF